jgi:hypothetical protein
VRKTMTVNVATGPLMSGIPAAGPGDQATPVIHPHHPAVSTAAAVAPRPSRLQRGRIPPPCTYQLKGVV